MCCGGPGLDLGPRDLTFIEGSSAQLETGHSVSGNPSRFDIGHVELRLDESWRTKLSPRDRRLVTAMTLPWLLRYRYPVRTTAP